MGLPAKVTRRRIRKAVLYRNFNSTGPQRLRVSIFVAVSVPRITLKPGKEMPLLRKHLWVFSGAIERIEGEPRNGDVVDVYDHQGSFLATGHYEDGSIAVRIISFRQVLPDAGFWNQRMSRALAYRETFGIMGDARTNAWRLVHAEGDGLPGLVVDIFSDLAVIETHSTGMTRSVGDIAEGLKAALPGRIQTIYHREVKAEKGAWLLGDARDVAIIENGRQFLVDAEGGQKTGFFLDQRDNRQFVSLAVKDKSVLDAFSYTGGFAVYALSAGARQADCIDSSARALELLKENMKLNGLTSFTPHVADVGLFLKSAGTYDIVIVDPPPLARNRVAVRAALKRYRSLNAEALRHVERGGMLFTFSCSQHVDRDSFEHVIRSAVLDAGREARVFHRFAQPADHPVNMLHPEVEYLKGVALPVD